MAKQRTECPTCGSSLRHVGRRQNNTNGHHRNVYECGECGQEVLGG